MRSQGIGRLFFIISISILFFSCSGKKTVLSDQPERPRSSARFDNLYFKALSERAIQNYESAIILLGKCLELQPKSDVVYFQLAMVTKELDKTKALHYLDQAISLNGDNVWYLEEKASLLMELGQTDEGFELYKSLITKNPNVPAYYERAIGSLSKRPATSAQMLELLELREKYYGVSKRFTEYHYKLLVRDKEYLAAKEVLDKLIEKYPRNVNYQLDKVQLLSKMGHETTSLILLNRLAQEHQDNADVYLRLISHQLDQGSEDEIMFHCRRYLSHRFIDAGTKITTFSRIENSSLEKDSIHELAKVLTTAHPDQRNTWNILAQTSADIGDYENAVKALERSKGLESEEEFLAFDVLVQYSWKMFDFARLKKYSEEALEYFPSSSLYYRALAFAHLVGGNLAEARTSIEAGLDYSLLETDQVEMLNVRTELLLQENNSNKAVELFQELLTLFPDNPELKNYYASLLARSNGDQELANRLITSLLESQPDNPDFLMTKGILLLNQGLPKEAVKVLMHSLSNTNPQNPYTHHYLSKAFQELGESSLSQKHHNEALKLGLPVKLVN